MSSIYDSPVYINDLQQAYEASVGFEQLQNKRVLITGASGLIGSFLVDLLVWANRERHMQIGIYALGRSRVHMEECFKYAKDEVQLIEQDVSKVWNIPFAVDMIIHAAGSGHPAAFQSDPTGTMITHWNGTQYMLEYARACGTERVLYVSTGEIYGQMPTDCRSFCENENGYLDFMQPRSCYPASKRAAETLCAAYYKQYGVPVVVARPSHIYGANFTKADNRATAQFLRKALRGEPIVLNSAGNQLRSYTYIADCASAIWTLLVGGCPGEAYNIANSSSVVTIAGFAKLLAEAAGCDVTFQNPDDHQRSMQSPISFQVLDSRKLEMLGWRGRYSIDEGILNMLEVGKSMYL
jgi:nucleoside-diphosphate-sugar epimerase